MAGVEDRVKQLEAQIDALEKDAEQRDADGDPTLAAMTAQKSLPKLYAEWRMLVKGQRTPTAGLENVYDPRSSWTSVDPETGQETKMGEVIGLRDPISGTTISLPKETASKGDWSLETGPDGNKYWVNAKTQAVRPATEFGGKPAPTYAPQYPRVITQGRSAYKVDPYTGAVEKVYDFPEEEPTAWNREQEDRKYDWWKLEEEGKNERRRQDAEDAMRRQRLTSAVGLAGNIADATQKAVPYAMLPGQKYFLGAEPGGVYSNIAQMSGRSFDPETMRPQPIPFDGLQAWRLAQGALGVE